MLGREIDFMLNEIKTKDDSLRQFLAANIILIGAYITVVINVLLKLSDIMPVKFSEWQVWPGLIFCIIGAVVVVVPIGLWVQSIIQILNSFMGITLPNEILYPIVYRQLNPDQSKPNRLLTFLIDTNDEKANNLLYSSVKTLQGLGVVLLVTVVFVAYWLFFYVLKL